MKNLLLTFALLLTGCASSNTASDATIAPHPGHITHVVLIWMKDRSDSAGRQKLIDTAYSFQTMPGILNISCGKMVPAKRSAVDSTYDVGLVMQFDNLENERAYEANPVHKKAVDEVLHPLSKRILVYDFQE